MLSHPQHVSPLNIRRVHTVGEPTSGGGEFSHSHREKKNSSHTQTQCINVNFSLLMRQIILIVCRPAIKLVVQQKKSNLQFSFLAQA